MKYEVKKVQNKLDWEDFSLKTHPNTFLQSWNWGVFNESVGRKIFRLGLYQDKKLVGISLLVKHETSIGNYLYCPRGPVLDWTNQIGLNILFREIKKIAKEEGAIFVKLDPLLEESTQNRQIFKENGFISAVTFVQVEDAWLLNLNKSEEELLSDMRKTTRYLVRHELEKGIKVEISDKLADIRKFADLLYSTASRKNFVNHPKSYYIKQFEILSKADQMRVFKAVRNNKILAMAVIAFYADTAYYLHGASVASAGSAGYPLQWGGIKKAKKRRIKKYNFWGVVKDKNFHPGHPWYGFSLFKRGFGGYKYSYIRAKDLPTSPKYWLNRYLEQSRRLSCRIQQGYWED